MTNYKNSIWYSFLTITTIGYGDIVTFTVLGRIATILLSLISLLLNSFLIVAFDDFFK